MTQDPNPHEALAAIRAARADFPDGGNSIGYDLFYGGACALLVAGQGMPRPWDFVVLPIALAAFGLMIMWWRKKYGWWVSGYSPKRARWVAFALVAVLVGLMGLSLYGRYVGPHWLWVVSGGIAFVAAVVGGRLWMRVWRKELAEGPK